jgi:hypothetical protein
MEKSLNVPKTKPLEKIQGIAGLSGYKHTGLENQTSKKE